MTSPGRTGRNMPVAIATGVLLAAVFLASLFWHPLALLTFVFLLVLVALLELEQAFAARGAPPATPVTAGAGAIAIFGAYVGGAPAQALAVVALFVGAVLWSLVRPGRDGVLESMGATVLVGVWVPFCASFAALLATRPDGSWYVLTTIALAVVTDIGAFGFGSVFGRHKLAPRVSPGKTWEGLAGGLAAALVVGAAAGAWLPGLDVLLGIVFAAAVSLAATLGDLAESLVKRGLGVKDLGRVLPGHGGIMDRVDSIILALPVAHVTLLAVGT